MEGKKRVVKTAEGIEVDAGSGEVVDRSPIDLEHPEYRVFDSSDYLKKSHYHPLRPSSVPPGHRFVCRDEDDVNRILDKILPGLIAALRSVLLSSLCGSEPIEVAQGFEAVRRVVESRLSMSIGEATAYDIGGFVGLVVYRCLKNAGAEEDAILDSLKGVERGGNARNPVGGVVEDLKNAISKSFNEALIRWISRPSEDIDLEFASKTLSAPIKRARRALQIVTKVDGIGVQITSKKIDVSATIGDRDRVFEVLSRLSKRLGVELSAPIPMVATVVLRLPFEVDLENLKRFGNAVQQGMRMKIEGRYWTALVFKRTVNIYVDLRGSLERFKSAVAEVLPDICRYAKSM